MTHKNIRILFVIGDRKYEAVGFLEEKETPVGGNIMLERVAGENGGAIGEEEAGFIAEHRDLLPEKLEKYNLFLKRYGVIGGIPCFHWQCGRWSWGVLYGRYGSSCLVVRRVG